MRLGTRGLRFSLNFQNMLWSTYYQNTESCFFILIMHGYHGNQLQRFSLQSSKITKWIWQKSLFFLALYLRKVFISFVFNTNYERDHLDQTLLHYHNYIYFPLIASWQYHVWRCIQRLGLMKKIHIFSKFENMCIKLQACLGSNMCLFWKSKVCRNIWQ